MRAEVHQSLSEIAGAAVPGQRLGVAAELGGGPRQRRLDPMQPRHHPQYVAVDRDRRLLESDRAQGARGIGADARQRPERSRIGRQPAAVAQGHDPGERMERARAPIIAETLPGVQDLRLVGGRQRGEARKALDEACEAAGSPSRPWSAGA